jgi:hypothetical protein
VIAKGTSDELGTLLADLADRHSKRVFVLSFSSTTDDLYMCWGTTGRAVAAQQVDIELTPFWEGTVDQLRRRWRTGLDECIRLELNRARTEDSQSR